MIGTIEGKILEILKDTIIIQSKTTGNPVTLKLTKADKKGLKQGDHIWASGGGHDVFLVPSIRKKDNSDEGEISPVKNGFLETVKKWFS